MTTHIIIMRETVAQSLARDAGTVVAAFAMTVPGWWFGNTALTVIGAILFIAWFLARATGVASKAKKTPEEALAEILAIIEAEKA